VIVAAILAFAATNADDLLRLADERVESIER
jgi:hypothetical protein